MMYSFHFQLFITITFRNLFLAEYISQNILQISFIQKLNKISERLLELNSSFSIANESYLFI